MGCSALHSGPNIRARGCIQASTQRSSNALSVVPSNFSPQGPYHIVVDSGSESAYYNAPKRAPTLPLLLTPKVDNSLSPNPFSHNNLHHTPLNERNKEK